MSQHRNDPTIVVREVKSVSFLLHSFVNNDTHKVSNGAVVGREIDCNVRLKHTKVSRYHAKFVEADMRLYIEDLHSTNGTLINGRRITEPTPISLGDEISFGDQRYRVTTENNAHSEATQLFIPSSAERQHANIVTPSAPIAVPPPLPDPAPAQAPIQAQPPIQVQTPIQVQNDDGKETRLYSPDQIMSIAQRNLERHSDFNEGSGPRFVILTAPLRGQICPIGLPQEGRILSIGRDESCDICIAEESISRQHAVLIYEGKQFKINSTHEYNALLINGSPQGSNAVLRHGDQVQLGRIDALFRTDVQRENPLTIEEADSPSNYRVLLVATGLTIAVAAAVVIFMFF